MYWLYNGLYLIPILILSLFYYYTIADNKLKILGNEFYIPYRQIPGFCAFTFRML